MIFALISAFAADWNQTIDDVVGSVLVLRYEKPRAFDGDQASTPQASGFIVDAERGLILSNRHVVGTAPQVAHALFPNQEEIQIEPLYSDPIHDFGFYRYDPAQVEINKPRSLRLDPKGARMGAEIRLIGNDAGEQISILDGTISRIDRPAPWWDMNTFYVQAASDSSGGSSGSPVFDIDGDVVALNAGGRTKESTSYYLRLERVQRALEYLQRDEVPPRGTVMTRFVYRPYDELHRLGLTRDTEQRARKEWDGTGMLVVSGVTPGGPADTKLRPGDILLEANGERLYDFASMEAIWDDNVGATLPVLVERAGKQVQVELNVADLHTHEPDAFVRFGRSVFYALSYKAIANTSRAPGGVVLGSSRGMFRNAAVPENAVIEAIDGNPIPDLNALVGVLSGLKLGEVASVMYTTLNQPDVQQVARIRMEPEVLPNERCEVERAEWTCTSLPHPTERATVAPHRPRPVEVAHKPARALANRLVTVRGTRRFPLNTLVFADHQSAGIVIDGTSGLILTDRYTVAGPATDITVEMGDSGRIPADIVQLDPMRNAALIRVDPQVLQLGALPPIEWSDTPPEHDGAYWAALLDTDGVPFSIPRTFSRYDELSLVAHRYPKYRADNISVLRFGKVERPTIGGAIVDKKGRIVSLYVNFSDAGKKNGAKRKFHAIPTWVAQDMLADRQHLYTGLDVRRANLANAREAGVSDEALEQLRQLRPFDPVAIEVWRVQQSVSPEVRAGDFITAVDGKPVAVFQDLQQSLRADSKLTVYRDGERLEVSVGVRDLVDDQPSQALLFAGALIQQEHPEVAREAGIPARGVYVSWYYSGTPAQRYNLYYGQRVTSVNGQPVEDLDSFAEAVKGLEHGQAVRLGVETLQGRQGMLTLRVDTEWWPTLRIRLQDGDWVTEAL